jgi:hypothetical protein
MLNKLAVFSLSLFVFMGCYRFPTEEDYSLVPLTNNPDLRDDRGGAPSAVPGLPNGNY